MCISQKSNEIIIFALDLYEVLFRQIDIRRNKTLLWGIENSQFLTLFQIVDSSLLFRRIYMPRAYMITGVGRNYLSRGWVLGCTSMPISIIIPTLFFVENIKCIIMNTVKNTKYNKEKILHHIDIIKNRYNISILDNKLIIANIENGYLYKNGEICYDEIADIRCNTSFIDIILYSGIVISLSTIDNIITCINLHESFEQGTDISNVEFSNDRISMNIYKKLSASLKS